MWVMLIYNRTALCMEGFSPHSYEEKCLDFCGGHYWRAYVMAVVKKEICP